MKGKIDPARFSSIVAALGFDDAVLVENPDAPDPSLVKFFSRVVYGRGGGDPIFSRQAERWENAAPIAARYPELRDEGLSSRRRSALWFEFCREIIGAGLYVKDRWAPPHAAEEEEGEEELEPPDHEEPEW